MQFCVSSNGSLPVNRKFYSTYPTQTKQWLFCWKEYFSIILKQRCDAYTLFLDDIPQEEVQTQLSEPPLEFGFEQDIKQLASGKAPGPDGIPSKILKVGSKSLSPTT